MKASIKIFQALEYISFFLSIISKLLCNRNKKSELYVWPWWVQGGRDYNQSKVGIRGTRGSRTTAGNIVGSGCGLRDLFGEGWWGGEGEGHWAHRLAWHSTAYNTQNTSVGRELSWSSSPAAWPLQGWPKVKACYWGPCLNASYTLTFLGHRPPL